MNNIFKNAYFGKAYKTRDNRRALLLAIHTNNISPYIEDAYIELLIDNYPRSPSFTMCNSLGQCTDDYHPNESIVSEWKEEINEDELDKLAKEHMTEEKRRIIKGASDLSFYDLETAFKAGFRARGCYCKGKD